MGIQTYSLRGFGAEEAFQKINALGIHWIEPYRVHYPVSIEQKAIKAMNAMLQPLDLHVSAHGVHGFSKDHEKNEILFKFAKLAGIRNLSANPSKDSFDSLEKLVDKYKSASPSTTTAPGALYDQLEDSLKAVKGRDKRIGFCADLGHYIRSGIDPVHAIEALSGRLFGIHLKDFAEKEKRTKGVILGERYTWTSKPSSKPSKKPTSPPTEPSPSNTKRIPRTPSPTSKSAWRWHPKPPKPQQPKGNDPNNSRTAQGRQRGSAPNGKNFLRCRVGTTPTLQRSRLCTIRPDETVHETDSCTKLVPLGLPQHSTQQSFCPEIFFSDRFSSEYGDPVRRWKPWPISTQGVDRFCPLSRKHRLRLAFSQKFGDAEETKAQIMDSSKSLTALVLFCTIAIGEEPEGKTGT